MALGIAAATDRLQHLFMHNLVIDNQVFIDLFRGQCLGYCCSLCLCIFHLKVTCQYTTALCSCIQWLLSHDCLRILQYCIGKAFPYTAARLVFSILNHSFLVHRNMWYAQTAALHSPFTVCET